MEMPITRPSMVSYADEVNFPELLEDLLKKKHSGFIRVTSGSEEGYILFKEGQQVAASYERHSKSNAVEIIKSAMENSDTVIEVFNLRSSYVNYLMDVNKSYLMEPDYDVYKVIKELRGSEVTETEIEVKTVPPVVDEVKETETVPEVKEPVAEEKLDLEELKEKFDIGKLEDRTAEVDLERDKSSEDTEINEPSEDTKIDKSSEDTEITFETSESPIESENIEATEQNIQDEKSVEESEKQELRHDDRSELMEKHSNSELMERHDRSELMEKYGIKEINADDLDEILESYKGGSLSNEDVEKIELNLMNKIKKSIYGIPKVKGAEVMVFLDHTKELSGNVNIIMEYEPKGFLSRLMGDYKDTEQLRLQVMEIVQIELKKSFRKYPKIVDNFDIKVEIG
jgi:hypothetical protein